MGSDGTLSDQLRFGLGIDVRLYACRNPVGFHMGSDQISVRMVEEPFVL